MKTGKCPKCGSNEIYSGESVKAGHNAGILPISTWSSASIIHYVCTDCGYVEGYVREKEKLQKIKEKWSRV